MAELGHLPGEPVVVPRRRAERRPRDAQDRRAERQEDQCSQPGRLGKPAPGRGGACAARAWGEEQDGDGHRPTRRPRPRTRWWSEPIVADQQAGTEQPGRQTAGQPRGSTRSGDTSRASSAHRRPASRVLSATAPATDGRRRTSRRPTSALMVRHSGLSWRRPAGRGRVQTGGWRRGTLRRIPDRAASCWSRSRGCGCERAPRGCGNRGPAAWIRISEAEKRSSTSWEPGEGDPVDRADTRSCSR